MVSEIDDIVVLEEVPCGHSVSVDLAAIKATEIEKPVAPFLLTDHGMAAADLGIGNDQIAFDVPPHNHHAGQVNF